MPLNGLGPRSLAYRQATAKNNTFVATRRCNMRELLQQAHDRGVLPYTNYTPDTRSSYLGQGTAKDRIILYSSESDTEQGLHKPCVASVQASPIAGAPDCKYPHTSTVLRILAMCCIRIRDTS